ncbi:MAG: helix-turn-helix domain-containing protein [Helicobacteraceae bacterium]|nr:helix-turn-helix domain-containing protein [Candidatus Sulfurimonas ponti]MBL6973400.1 helix-turn-helix domain-containing protein [Sulfurimonas sp.]
MEDIMFDELLASVKETKSIMRGEAKPSRVFLKNPNPKVIREKLELTQEQFAALMNISVYTLRNWEQGRREPEGPAKVLLNVVNYHPEVLKEMVH